MEPTLREVSLDDKYRLGGGPVLVSGTQALVRLVLMQRELDRRAGLNTAGYVTGYRGSPLGGLDRAFWGARAELDAAGIAFVPAVNEDLAATALWGSQQIDAVGGATVDGVFGMWYGKGPGVDRAGDPLKHGNYTGTHRHGGVLAVFGDDHMGKSSTIAHHSEQALAANSIPVLYPADVGEFVAFGLLGYALSRYSGCWVGLKTIAETVEQTKTVDFELDRFAIERPDRADLLPPEGVNYRGVYAPLQDELILMRHKLPLVQRFAAANRIDRVALGEGGALGIVTAGKAHQDVVAALRQLGIDDARARSLGVSVYKVGLIWPLEPSGLRAFAEGKRELFFVEEKAAFVEPQAAAVLYPCAARPRIVGKTDENGALLVPPEMQLEPLELALRIADRMRALDIGDAALGERVAALRSYRGALLQLAAPGVRRLPYFCSGCPHNTSTSFPEGSIAIAGIGCHGMAMWAKPGTLLGTHMGGEGLGWVGLHRFTERKHIFQNLGDGTYYHSGLLAIRAAIASGANITYKILYNDAIAMTGGQPFDGPLSPAAVAQQVLAEGARKVALVTDDPQRYASGAGLPTGVAIHHRDHLDEVQRELRETPGCTVLIYEQTCAAEKRRRRKRDAYPDPPKRMFINAAVCEGCGDCSVQSGCVSIEPIDTPLGAKRRINQSTCNKDYSCVKGFCPSFLTVYGGTPRRPAPVLVGTSALAALPEPVPPPDDADGFNVMIAGIGGTGVITVGAVLAMAAHLCGRAASVYDMTGLAQKNGAVYSHLRLAPRADRIASARLGLGDASLVLAFDLIAALGDESFRTIGAGTRVIGNDRVQPLATADVDPSARVETRLLQRKLEQKVAAGRLDYVDATGIATALCGDAMATNMFMVGVALQKGWLPVPLAALERAIELNGVQVDFNKRAVALGRLWVHDPDAIRQILAATGAAPASSPPPGLDSLVADRERLLTSYQDVRYAQRYRRLVDRVAAAEARVAPGTSALTTAVADNFARLMAYKDEYEVARLYADPSFRAALRAEFDGDVRLVFNLAPPLLARRDPRTGHLLKREYGGWMLRVFGLLARLRFLRGGPLDPFGRTEERRMERAAIERYERDIDAVLAALGPGSLALAVEIANLPGSVRGFGHVKQRNAAQADARREALLAALAGGEASAPAPSLAA